MKTEYRKKLFNSHNKYAGLIKEVVVVVVVVAAAVVVAQVVASVTN